MHSCIPAFPHSRIPAFNVVTFAVLVVVVAACSAPEGTISRVVEPSGLMADGLAGSPTLERISGYSAAVHSEVTLRDGRLAVTDSRIAVTHEADAIAADLEILPRPAGGTASSLGSRKYRLAWDRSGTLSSVDDRGRAMKLHSTARGFTDSVLQSIASPKRPADSSAIALRELLRQPSPGGQMGRGRFVHFVSSSEARSARLRLEQRFGAGRPLGDQLEFHGQSAAGSVTARIDRLTSTLEFLRISHPVRGTVETTLQYQRALDDLFACIRIEFTQTDGTKVTRRSLLEISNLVVTGAR